MSSSKRNLPTTEGVETRAMKKARSEAAMVTPSGLSSPPASPGLPPRTSSMPRHQVATQSTPPTLSGSTMIPSSPPASPSAHSWPVEATMGPASPVLLGIALASMAGAFLDLAENNTAPAPAEFANLLPVPSPLDSVPVAPAATNEPAEREAPIGQPPLWSPHRQGLLETTTWMKAMQSSAYTKDGLLHGVYLGKSPTPRGACVGGVIITIM